MRGISGPRLPEELGDEIGEVVPPVAPHVALFGGSEGVLDVVLDEHLVERLGAGKEAVGFAAGNVEELQFLIAGAESAIRSLYWVSSPSGRMPPPALKAPTLWKMSRWLRPTLSACPPPMERPAMARSTGLAEMR